MAIRTKTELKVLFANGQPLEENRLRDLIDTLISQINDKLPDEEGRVTTDFQIIAPLGPDAPPSSYPNGASEFVIDYNPADYADFIAANPEFEQIQAGTLSIRTFKVDPDMCVQEVYTINNGKFYASFFRICEDNENWMPLSTGSNLESIAASIPKIDPNGVFEKDEDGNLKLKTAETSEQLADGSTLVVNQEGKLVSVNSSVVTNILGTLDSEDDLPETGQNGESYWIDGKLYTWNDDKQGGAGFVESPSLKGPEGPQGERGNDGVDGINGTNGTDGAPGPKGDKGDKGDTGPVGATGPRGATGNQGPPGERGPEGPEGQPGPKGEDGADGEQGPAGPQGLPGIAGPAGPQGQRGPTGERGQGFEISGRFDSVSAAETALENEEGLVFYIIQSNDEAENGKVYLWDGALQESIFQFQSTGLKGDKGDEGPEGPAGPAGMQGPQGERGITGAQGPQGIQGAQGIRGLKGEDGTSINLIATLPGGTALPTTANNGDAYWRAYTLFIWSDKKEGGPGFVEGFNLRGLPGEQGPQGPQGPAGPLPEGIGSAELETQAKTIREAINEVFQSGNNVKSDTVAALLSKNPNAGVTVDSTWEEIEQAIRDLPQGGTVVGREVNYRWLYPDDLKFGEFVKYYTNGLNAQDADAHQISNSYYDLASSAFMLPIGKDRLVTFCSVNGASSNLGVRIIEVKNKRIIPLGTYRTVNVTQYSGYYSNAIMMNDTKGVYLCTFGNNVGLHLRAFVINGNEFETPTNGVDVINVAGAGMGAILTKLTNDRFMVHSNENGTLTRRIYSFNSTANTFAFIESTVLKSGTGVLRDKIQVVPIKEEDGKLVYAVKFIDTANLVMAYAIYSLDLSTMGATVIHPISNVIPPTGSVTHSGKHATMHLWDYNGVKKLIFFHPNSGSSYRLTYTEIELDAVTSAPKDNTLTSVQVSAVNNSGGNANNVGTYNFHNEYFISPYEMVVGFSNNTNAYSLVFDLTTKTSSIEFTLRSGANSSTHPYSAITNDHQFVFALTNGASVTNARPYRAYAFNPFSHVRKAVDGDTIIGVVTSPATYPNQVGVTRPPLA